MPLPTSKSELLKNLQQAYEKLDGEFDGMDESAGRICEISAAGETTCSICDVLAYQIGWGELLLSWDKHEKANKTVHMPAKGFKWNQLGELAAHFYDKHTDHSLKQLRSKFKRTYNKLYQWIESLSDDELFSIGMREWTGDKWPMVKWIQVNTVAPYQSARTKVRRFKRDHIKI
ncbi:ClbS/DfsB family four-helix bundle protein [Poriferisphaera sp. WC338]|uniref:ClbS/DfsB family four-helix bundle protein n=1 Tax=Poriferisphaera sp. WC338 TaxID=3425129 RepID=UPI003D815853